VANAKNGNLMLFGLVVRGLFRLTRYQQIKPHRCTVWYDAGTGTGGDAH
jgi:hypothetical protein